MSPRMGRPKADNPKDIKYSIRIDSKTEDALQDYCKKIVYQRVKQFVEG